MGGGKGGSPPPAPDYSALAKEQAAANVAAAKQTAGLSNPNVVSPWGKQTVTYNTQYAKPAPVKPTLAAPTGLSQQEAQAKATQEVGGAVNRQNLGAYNSLVSKYTAGTNEADRAAYDKAMEQYKKDMADYEASAFTTPTIEQGFGSPEQEAAWKAQQTANQRLAELGVSSIGRVEDVMGKGFNYTGPGIQTSVGDAGNIGQVDLQKYGQASGGPSANDYTARGNLGDTGQVTKGLDTSNLAAMPVNAGTTGQQAIMNRLQPQLESQRSQLQTQLANQGITPGSEAYRNAMMEQGQRENDLMSQASLQGINLDMSARQQGFGEATTTAGFQNEAQNQIFQQALASGQFENAADAANFARQQAATQMGNAAIGQNQQTALAEMQANNAAQNQKYNQMLQSAQFGNTAGEQEFQRQLGLYNLPLNQVSALMGGSQITMPQFQGYQGAGVTAAPIFQAGQAQNQYNMDRYNADVAQSNAQMNAMASLGGAAMFALSDRRSKTDIEKIGKLDSGLNLYKFKYIGSDIQQIGVMSDEVREIFPDAVVVGEDGFDRVDYSKLV